MSEVVVEGDRLTVVSAGRVVLDVAMDADALASVTHRAEDMPTVIKPWPSDFDQ